MYLYILERILCCISVCIYHFLQTDNETTFMYSIPQGSNRLCKEVQVGNKQCFISSSCFATITKREKCGRDDQSSLLNGWRSVVMPVFPVIYIVFAQPNSSAAIFWRGDHSSMTAGYVVALPKSYGRTADDGFSLGG